jgi:integrase
MPVAKLTARNVKSLPAVGGKRTDYRDAGFPGFFLRVSDTGARSYGVVYTAPDGRLRRYTIGSAHGQGALGLAEAHSIAAKMRAHVTTGHDPQTDKLATRRRSGTTVAAVIDDFLADQQGRWRPATRAGWVRFLRREVLPVLGRREIAQVTKRDVRSLVDRIKNGGPNRKGAPVSALATYEVLRRLFRWAVSHDAVAESPCALAAADLPRRRKADTVYSDGELRFAIRAAQNTNAVRLVRLIAYTATRDLETRAATWVQFDLGRALWTIPPERSKSGDRTGNPHVVPLSAGALRVLAEIREANLAAGQEWSPLLFPARGSGHSEPKHMTQPNRAAAAIKTRAERLDRRLARYGARRYANLSERGLLHNLRRTVATRLSQHAVPVHIIEHVLGHALPALIRTYQVHVPLAEMREALAWWSDELDRILGRR